MYDGLRHQHPIKRVRVEGRKLARVKGRFLIHVERSNTTGFAKHRNKNIRLFRKGKTSRGVFDSDFPGGSYAEVTFVIRVQKDFRGSLAQAWRKALKSSSGNGSKNESVTTNSPLATPIRGLRPFLRRDRISATG